MDLLDVMEKGDQPVLPDPVDPKDHLVATENVAQEAHQEALAGMERMVTRGLQVQMAGMVHQDHQDLQDRKVHQDQMAELDHPVRQVGLH